MSNGYKKDQGRMARMAAFWSLALLLLFGSHFLKTTLYNLVEGLREPINGMEIPIVGIPVSGAFLISAVVFVVGMIVLYRWHQTPKVADLLIDTESEMKKVTWPGMQEVINSSVVVIFFVVFLMGFLAGADWFLARLARKLILG